MSLSPGPVNQPTENPSASSVDQVRMWFLSSRFKTEMFFFLHLHQLTFSYHWEFGILNQTADWEIQSQNIDFYQLPNFLFIYWASSDVVNCLVSLAKAIHFCLIKYKLL